MRQQAWQHIDPDGDALGEWDIGRRAHPRPVDHEQAHSGALRDYVHRDTEIARGKHTRQEEQRGARGAADVGE